MLLADWFEYFALEAGMSFPQRGRTYSSFTMGAPDAFNVTARFIAERPHLRFESSDPSRQQEVNKFAAQAAARVDAADFGTLAWYSVSLATGSFQFAPQFGLGTFLQQIGNQVRIIGWRKLGGHCLLEFAEEQPTDGQEAPALLAPKSIINAHLAVPGPPAGRFSSHIANAVVETVVAICSFALGRTVELPWMVPKAKDKLIDELIARAKDPGILTLARKAVPLDIFGFALRPGGLETYSRLRAALLTYDSAMQQRHDSVACLLYVVSAEALVAADVRFKDKRVVARFIDYYDCLMPDQIDELVAHGNFEAVFGIQRGVRTNEQLRKKLLNSIYSFRSGHVHEGLRPRFRGFMFAGAPMEGVRRGIFGEFAEHAILSTITSPRCSLTGSIADPKLTAGNCPICSGVSAA